MCVCLWCVNAVCATFAVIFNGSGCCFVAGCFAIDSFIFAFGGGQVTVASCCSALIVLYWKDKKFVYSDKFVVKTQFNWDDWSYCRFWGPFRAFFPWFCSTIVGRGRSSVSSIVAQVNSWTGLVSAWRVDVLWLQTSQTLRFRHVLSWN